MKVSGILAVAMLSLGAVATPANSQIPMLNPESVKPPRPATPATPATPAKPAKPAKPADPTIEFKFCACTYGDGFWDDPTIKACRTLRPKGPRPKVRWSTKYDDEQPVEKIKFCAGAPHHFIRHDEFAGICKSLVTGSVPGKACCFNSFRSKKGRTDGCPP